VYFVITVKLKCLQTRVLCKLDYCCVTYLLCVSCTLPGDWGKLAKLKLVRGNSTACENMSALNCDNYDYYKQSQSNSLRVNTA